LLVSVGRLSKAVRAQLAKPGARGPAGPQGPGGAKGDPGVKGDPGPTLATFANTGGVPITGGPAVVTDTAGQPPGGSTGAIGGPITIPGGGRYTQITAVEVRTSASAGTLTCTVQASVNGGACRSRLGRKQAPGCAGKAVAGSGTTTRLEDCGSAVG
jgi:hypothetical protein